MAQTYCLRADIESILGDAGVLACIDDDQDGVESAAETLHVTNAIERAAVEMNSALRNQYILSALADNDWCKWCNAYLAAYYLTNRRNNPSAASITDEVTKYKSYLDEARWGRFQIPEQPPAFNYAPAVSNFRPELRKQTHPIRVVTEESTGGTPSEDVVRKVAYQEGTL